MRLRSGVLIPAVAGVMLSGAVTAGIAAPASNDQQQLERLQREIESGEKRERALFNEAARLSGEVASLQRRLVAVAAEVQTHETQVSELEAKLDELSAVERETRRDLNRRRDELSSMIGALTRLSRRPAQAMLLSPASTGDTVRSSLVMRQVVPALNDRASILRDQLVALKELRAEIAEQRAAMDDAGAALKNKKRELNTLLAAKADARRRTVQERESEGRRLATMVARANDLSQLLQQLQEEEAKRQPGTEDRSQTPLGADTPEGSETLTATLVPFTASRGRLPLPVRGRIMGRFGEPDDSGTPVKGITVETRKGAAVVSPNDGKVVFAGPFRGYGELLIISVGEGYHILLAGLARADVSVGQWLLAGEPVGLMAETDEQTSSGTRPHLYIELRHQGEPINPLPWMTAGKRKVSG